VLLKQKKSAIKALFCGSDLVVAEDGDVAESMVEIDVEISAENDVESSALGKNDDEPTAVAENVKPTTVVVAEDGDVAESVVEIDVEEGVV
jgi:hypothetical protein